MTHHGGDTSTSSEVLNEDVRLAQRVFAEVTGVRDVTIRQRESGLEVFHDVVVGAKAPIYQKALAEIDDRLPENSPLRGALILAPEHRGRGVNSLEAQTLGSLIRRSLAVSRDALQGTTLDVRVAFPEHQEAKVVEPVHHFIWGRRGVGKSSLILTACRDLLNMGCPVAWVGAESYTGRDDPLAFVQLLGDAIADFQRSADMLSIPAEALSRLADLVARLEGGHPEIEDIGKHVPQAKRELRDWESETGKRAYLFLDDAHLIGAGLQPFVFRQLRDLFSGAGAVVNIAGVRNLMVLRDAERDISVQVPHDYQSVLLDLTLQDPAKAKLHLENVLGKFAMECGFSRISSVVRPEAVERLVWCSGGVPRDFLWLVDAAMQHAARRRRDRAGKEDVNLATGELANDKLEMIEAEASDADASVLKRVLDKLQTKLLDEYKSNSFLVRKDTEAPGYTNVQKLADLRLIHLLHQSITPGEAGDKHEAYLLDYTFYTGVRRRHRLDELQIDPDAPPKYSTLRQLRRVELELFE